MPESKLQSSSLPINIIGHLGPHQQGHLGKSQMLVTASCSCHMETKQLSVGTWGRVGHTKLGALFSVTMSGSISFERRASFLEPGPGKIHRLQLQSFQIQDFLMKSSVSPPHAHLPRCSVGQRESLVIPLCLVACFESGVCIASSLAPRARPLSTERTRKNIWAETGEM